MSHAAAAGAAGADERRPRSLEIDVARSDRLFLVGATGSGKTTFARTFLRGQAHIAILDPKHDFTWGPKGSGFSRHMITSDWRELLRYQRSEPVIYRPTITELSEGCPQFFWWVWERGHTIAYIDEVQSVSKPVNIPPMYARCIQQGRTRGIGIWSATQRPSRIPIVVVSEAEHHVTFELRHPDDRKRMANYSDPAMLDRQPSGHQFWYYRAGKGLRFYDGLVT